jgi:hypothetical protein
MNAPDPRARQAPLPPGTQSIADALGHSEALVSLGQRLRASNDRLAAVQPLLPPALRTHVRAGPLDEAGWTLLVDNQAVSAKLRQLLPALEAQLRQTGWPAVPLRVKVLARR